MTVTPSTWSACTITLNLANRAGKPPLMLALLFANLVCLWSPEGVVAQSELEAREEAAATITVADLSARIGALAHDSMRGRATPSPEIDKAARHIAGRFKEFGLLPGDGDSYLQLYPLAFSVAGPPEEQSLEIVGPGGGEIAPEDFISLPGGGVEAAGPLHLSSLINAADLTTSVSIVYVKETEVRDAMSAVRGLLTSGAEGVVLAIDSSDEYFDGLRRFLSREQMSLGVPDELEGPAVLVRLSSLPAALQEALTSESAVTDYSARVRTNSRFRGDQAFNTIGWIEGSDPELRDEYVVFTAHMDHVGVGRPVEGDSIYNGADDDASGTAAIIELAEAFASLRTPPRRSLIFMTVSGEERGLLGSRWYSENPLFPLESTVANLNIDMIGRNWQDTVVAIGRDESTLGATLEGVVADHPELGLTMIDDPWPSENFYFRSDHYNFARKGVPILFFFTGTHEDYHGPNDEADRILYDKTSRITQLIFFLGFEIADASKRPEWDLDAYRRVVEGGSE